VSIHWHWPGIRRNILGSPALPLRFATFSLSCFAGKLLGVEINTDVIGKVPKSSTSFGGDIVEDI